MLTLRAFPETKFSMQENRAGAWGWTGHVECLSGAPNNVGGEHQTILPTVSIFRCIEHCSPMLSAYMACCMPVVRMYISHTSSMQNLPATSSHIPPHELCSLLLSSPCSRLHWQPSLRLLSAPASTCRAATCNQRASTPQSSTLSPWGRLFPRLMALSRSVSISLYFDPAC